MFIDRISSLLKCLFKFHDFSIGFFFSSYSFEGVLYRFGIINIYSSCVLYIFSLFVPHICPVLMVSLVNIFFILMESSLSVFSILVNVFCASFKKSFPTLRS